MKECSRYCDDGKESKTKVSGLRKMKQRPDNLRNLRKSDKTEGKCRNVSETMVVDLVEVS